MYIINNYSRESHNIQSIFHKTHHSLKTFSINRNKHKYARILQKLSLIFHSGLQTQNYPAHKAAGVCALNCGLFLGLCTLSFRAFLLLSDPLLFASTLCPSLITIRACIRLSKTHLFIAFFIQFHGF